MSAPLLATKLYIPSPRPKAVHRPRLIEKLNQGQPCKLTLISAPAGFGKTTLLSEWLAQCEQPVAWLSLDEGDGDPARFLAYLVAALQTLAPNVGASALAALQSPQPPPIESILTTLLNALAAIPNDFILILDDYHTLDAKPVDDALAFLLERLPPQMRLVIASREDPPLPLARLRARGQLTELRAADLRFTLPETAEFLNHVMSLDLSADDIAALESRTEGWIAGLQLAAISIQGRKENVPDFITTFTGSHHFVLDYLVEEVLQQQPESVQTFLLCTSILDRLYGPLCDALMGQKKGQGQQTLEYLLQANLFIVPLDDERRWFRYHRLFADLLRQRLDQSPAHDAAELYRRASIWYENNGLEIDAFRHAAAANDIDRAARLLEGGGMPLHFRGAIAPVLNWLTSLPKKELDARPTLWVMYASVLSMIGKLPDTEQKLQAAEAALEGAELNAKNRNLIGHIAAIRALVAAVQYQIETIISQSRRALEYLHPDNLPVRTATIWKLGFAYQLQKNLAPAAQAYTEAVAISRATGNTIIGVSAAIGLGNIHEAQNQLHLAAETYQRVFQLAGDFPPPIVFEAHLGLARIYYEWNDLTAAERHAQQNLQITRQIENSDRHIACELFLARLKLAQGDAERAAEILAKAEQATLQHNFALQIPEVTAVKILMLLRQGNKDAASRLAQTRSFPLSQARVYLAQDNPSAALTALEPARQQAAANDWPDEQLKTIILQAIAHHALGQIDQALQLLGYALEMAEPGGFIRIFVDEGPPMAQLLSEAAVRGIMPDYTLKILTAFESDAAQPLIEPLSERELEVLQLIAQGLSNREISQQLFIALDTVKGHNRRIYGKLQVQRRTEAVAKARSLNLLPLSA